MGRRELPIRQAREKQACKMAGTRPNCAAGIPEGPAYRSNRGLQLGPPSEEMPTQARSFVQQDAPSAPVTQASVPEEPAGTTEPSNSTLPQGPSANGSPDGYAVVAVLAVLVLLAVGALIYFIAVGQGSDTGTSGAGGPTVAEPVREQGAKEVTTAQSSSAPNNGSLDQLVRRQVGDFTLQDKIELPEDANAGAEEALAMTYVAPDGTEVANYLFAFSSPEEANLVLRGQVRNSKTEGFEQVGGGNITNPEGQDIGAWAELKKEDTLVIHWTNNNKYAVIAGPEGYIDEFYAAVSAYY